MKRFLASAAIASSLIMGMSIPAQAGTITCSDGRTFDENDAVNGDPCTGVSNVAGPTGGAKCGKDGVVTGTPGIKCSNTGNPIYDFLNFIVNWALNLIIGIAVLAIVITGIQYITSQGNPDAIKKAKSRLTNAVVGLILLSLTRVILGLLKVI